MTSLADASPPIALGALDGRYRATVAPLVDHLSEAALNRERVRIEVEWLIHLTAGQVVPNVRALTSGEQTRLRQNYKRFQNLPPVLRLFGNLAVTRFGKLDAHSQQMVWIKARLYLLQTPEAFDEQARPD